VIDGIREYLQVHAIARVEDLVGTVDVHAAEQQWTSS
jgi:hypothetical protein